MVIICQYVGENVETKTQTTTIFSGTAPLLRATGEKYILPYYRTFKDLTVKQLKG